MELLEKQIAFFYRTSFELPFEALALKIKERLGNATDTQYLPIPLNAPPELPRLILSYPEYRIQFAKNRADIFFRRTVSQISNSISAILGQIDLTNIIRVGFVQKTFNETTLANALSLMKTPPSTAKEFSIKINIEKTISGFLCNSLEAVHFVTGEKNVNAVRTEVQGVVLERDANTVPIQPTGLFIADVTILNNLLEELQNEVNRSALLQDYEYSDQ